MASSIGGRGGREGSTKSAVAEQISQSVQSTANSLHLMRQSSPSHAQLMKLPKNLLAKTPTIKNTELVLKHMPQVISSLDEHVESGLHSVPHLDIVVQLLSNMRKIQLRSLSTLLEDKLNEEAKERHQYTVSLRLDANHILLVCVLFICLNVKELCKL